MDRQGFILDMDRCIGCGACQAACKELHQLAAGEFFRRAATLELRGKNGPQWVHFTLACCHCGEPACAAACPAGALIKAGDGTVLHRAELCLRCGRCIDACPYGAISRSRSGAIQKCDACAGRRENGLPPACAAACPTRALRFSPIKEDSAALPFLPAPEITKPALSFRGKKADADASAEMYYVNPKSASRGAKGGSEDAR